MHASPFREVLALASTSFLSSSFWSSDRNVLCPKASHQLASDDRRKERLFYFAVDLSFHNRDLTQHNSYKISLEVSIVPVPALREGSQDGELSEESIVVGCEEVLEGLN
jgi:hypothetical protein